MKVLSAHEDPDTGMVHAVVEFDDDQRQSVILPNWATKEHFVTEAQRMRDHQVAKDARRTHRPDLEGQHEGKASPKEDRHR